MFETCIHANHANELRCWENFPDDLKLHGLPSENPKQLVLWDALMRLGEESVQWRLPCPHSGQLNLFCDGTGTHPMSALSLAAWSFIDAQSGDLVASGWVPGIIQNNIRATCVRWAICVCAELHVWSDCSYVVEVWRSF